MKYKAVFFDFDYTLGNRDIYAYRLYRKMIEENSDLSDPVELEAAVQDMMIWDQKGNETKEYAKRMLKERWNINLPYDNINVWWDDRLWQYSCAYPDAVEVLKILREEGYLIGMISNGPSDGQRQKLEQAGLTDLVDSITVSGDIGVKKPDVRLFQLACERAGVKPEESVMVGDIFARDVLGAYRAGMQAVWYSVEKYMPCEADIPVIHSLSELPYLLKNI